MPEPRPVAFVDKYNQEWTLMLQEEVRGYTYKGRSILWKGKEGEGESKEDHGVTFLDIPISPKSEDRRKADDSRGPKVPASPRTGGSGGFGERGFAGDSGHGGSGRTPDGPCPGDSKGGSGNQLLIHKE